MLSDQALTVVIDGQTVDLGLNSSDALTRAVIISLFTWRRANADDDLPGNEKMGWWGDSYPVVESDKIGSRLWLLSRAKLTSKTLADAKRYCEEALQWLIDDGIAARVEVETERQGLSALAVRTRIYKPHGGTLDLRFAQVWESHNGV